MSRRAHAELAPVIAHRGASGDAPENTLAAMRLAAEQGARVVELDATLSHDGKAFVHHDDTLDRCTDATGYLCALSADELDRVHAGAGKAGFDDEPLPRFTAMLDLLAGLGLGLNVEIKPTAGLEDVTAEAVCDALDGAWPDGLPLVISSFSRESLAVAQQRLPDVARALIVGTIPRHWRDDVETLGLSNLHAAAELVTDEDIAAIRAAGLGLYCYTVNDAERARALLERGVHGVFSDYPGRLFEAGIARRD